jgi:hypothetical protein
MSEINWETVHVPRTGARRPEDLAHIPPEVAAEILQQRAGNPAVKDGAPLIGILVDRSGSMASCLDGMQAGLNDFVREQANLPGDAAVMLAQFDTIYERVWPMQPARSAPAYRLSPRGRTALLDAIGEFVTEIGETLADDQQYRPVVCCIVTDGLENASKEWTRTAVDEVIRYWRENYRWSFVFLGANMDAIAEAGSFGIPEGSALTFDTRNAKRSYALLSKHVTELRAGHAAAFSAIDRRRAIER